MQVSVCNDCLVFFILRFFLGICVDVPPAHTSACGLRCSRTGVRQEAGKGRHEMMCHGACLLSHSIVAAYVHNVSGWVGTASADSGRVRTWDPELLNRRVTLSQLSSKSYMCCVQLLHRMDCGALGLVHFVCVVCMYGLYPSRLWTELFRSDDLLVTAGLPALWRMCGGA